MPLLHLKDVSLAFGDVALLDHVELSIDAGERIALIGRNGAGKSSLLKVLAGEIAADDGVIAQSPSLKIAVVPQEPVFAENHRVFDAVTAGLGAVSRDLIAYHDVAHRAAESGDENLLDEMADLQTRIENADGWQINARVEETISRLKLDANADVAALSGGMKKRVALARALVAAPDLLLLDEPTNHLDIAGIEWLEETISSFAGATIVISHDRRFLETFATRIIELDRGHLASFPGSFADYLRRKAEMLNAEAVENARFDKLLKEEEVWIRKGVEARRTRNEGRVRRLEQLRRERAARRDLLGKVNFTLAAGERSGKIVAELIDVSKGYGERQLIRHLDGIVQRGDRVGLIGPNGVGKTTLIKLILGEIKPDSGTVKQGTQLEIAYFDQFRAALDPEATLADVISPGSEFVESGGGKKHIISYLGDFLFPPQRARAKVKSLSGGERNRLLLARLFAKPANLLVLDEPTNDLDIETLELLESLLQEYAGTVLLVSHDRAFLDNVVTQVFAFDADGMVREYAGGYADWLVQRAAAQANTSRESSADKHATRANRPNEERAKPRKTKLSFNDARELELLPGLIDRLDEERQAIEARLADPVIYATAGDEARKLSERLLAIAAETETAMARWEALEAKKEESDKL
jgi:ATP-binding cassette subfamily F protein uup